MTITKDTIIGDILNIAPQTAPLFMNIGMHCLGCPASRGETVEQACMVHGVDPAELLAAVNKGSRQRPFGSMTRPSCPVWAARPARTGRTA